MRPRPDRIALDLRGLIGMNEIFRLSGGVKRDPAVDMWLIEGGPGELQSIAQKWFAQVRHCDEGVREFMQDGCPVACEEDPLLADVNRFKTHVNVGFFQGAMLKAPASLL